MIIIPDKIIVVTQSTRSIYIPMTNHSITTVTTIVIINIITINIVVSAIVYICNICFLHIGMM